MRIYNADTKCVRWELKVWQDNANTCRNAAENAFKQYFYFFHCVTSLWILWMSCMRLRITKLIFCVTEFFHPPYPWCFEWTTPLQELKSQPHFTYTHNKFEAFHPPGGMFVALTFDRYTNLGDSGVPRHFNSQLIAYCVVCWHAFVSVH